MRDLARMLAPAGQGDDSARLRQGVVASVQAGPPRTLTVTVGGSVEVAGVRYLASYSPQPGDTVWLVQQGPVLVVLGDLA